MIKVGMRKWLQVEPEQIICAEFKGSITTLVIAGFPVAGYNITEKDFEVDKQGGILLDKTKVISQAQKDYQEWVEDIRKMMDSVAEKRAEQRKLKEAS